MRCIALFALSQCFGIIAFCQSPIISSQPAPPASPDALFNFDSDRFGRTSPSTRLPNLSCNGENPNTQATSPFEPNQPFHPPSLVPQILALSARNNLQPPAFPRGQRSRARSIPIPTEWPDAKPEPIPGTWPNLKFLPVHPGSAPAK